ncbi:MAG: hypothetical protein Q4F95_04550 [Oscillospiraceae bacterium]|nr:hypothetical protein [Oscillospiraceae bacterium]
MSFLLDHAGSAAVWCILAAALIIAVICTIRRKRHKGCSGCGGCCSCQSGCCASRSDTTRARHE